MNDKELIMSMADLARAAPKEWDKFLRAFRVYNGSLTNRLISSPVELLQVTQGYARNSQEVLQALETCTRTADQMKQKEK